jgi:catechol 2,3-dioxygenase-like lactoylglutathione lyase family enzyme
MENAAPSHTVTGLAHLLLQVSDLNSSEKFYCNLLGLTVKTRGTFGGDRPLISTHQGIGLTPLIDIAKKTSADQHNVEHVALWVTNLAALVNTLQDAGYILAEVKKNEYGIATSLRDPDGNRVELIEQL